MTISEDCQKAIARIYDQNQEISGTGFLVSSSYLITCAHVVIDALGIDALGFDQDRIPTRKVIIDIPQKGGKKPIQFQGQVVLWTPCPSFFKMRTLDLAQFGQDIALLKLEPEIIPKINPLKIVPIKDFSEQQEFHAYGFPQGNDSGELTEGKIMTETEKWLQLQGTYSSLPVRPGYSGCPTWFKPG